jgi:hypothetical protein
VFVAALSAPPGFAAVVTFGPVFEGKAYRLVDTNGADIANIVLGGLGLCDQPAAGGACNVDTPSLPEGEGILNQSDKILWVAILGVTGGRIGTGLLLCSDSGNDGGDNAVTSPASWNNPVDCNASPWTQLTRFVFESGPVQGVETTPWTPTAADPGFWPGNTTTYNLISDVPEPLSLMMIGSALLGGVGICRIRRRWRR